MITIQKATIKIDEDTLRQMLKMIDTHRVEHPDICGDPMPDGDMNPDTHHHLREERGYLRFTNHSRRMVFEITRSEVTRNRESEGWRWEDIGHYPPSHGQGGGSIA